MNYLIIELIYSIIFLLIGHLIINKYNKVSLDNIKKNPIIISFYLILIIGILVRIVGIETYPMVQDSDEINIGYDAYAIANYGVDKYALSLPVHLIGRGSGQNALYAYLSIPFIKSYGLSLFSIRILNSVISCISLLFVLYLINKSDIKDNRIKLIILIMASIFPWHICKARWGLESNIIPDLILYSMGFIYLGIKEKKKRYYYISSIILGLSMYAYGTSYLYLPVFIGLTYLYLLIKKYIKIKTVLLNALIIILITIPIVSFIFINNIKGDTYKFLGVFSVPKLYTNRMEDKSNLGSTNMFKDLINNLKESYSIFIYQADNRAINTVKNYGIYYKYSLPLIVIGLIYVFRSKNQLLHLNMIAFISAIILSSFLQPNINRLNVLWIPTMIFLIYGVIIIYKSNKNIGLIVMGLYLAQFACFINYYMNGYQEVLKNYKTHEIIQVLEDSKKYNYDNLYITSSFGENYSYYLFVYKPNPFDWNNNIIKSGGVKDYEYKQFNNVYFSIPKEIKDDDNNAYIISYSEYKNIDTKNKHIKYYEDYLLLY